jgi:hypothetical protein
VQNQWREFFRVLQAFAGLVEKTRIAMGKFQSLCVYCFDIGAGTALPAHCRTGARLDQFGIYRGRFRTGS